MKYPKIKSELDARRKLMPKDIAVIKRMHKRGVRQNQIAKKFGVGTFIIWYHTTSLENKRKHLDVVIAKQMSYLEDENYRNKHNAAVAKSVAERKIKSVDFLNWHRWYDAKFRMDKRKQEKNIYATKQ